MNCGKRMLWGGKFWQQRKCLLKNFLLFIAPADPLSMGPQKALETIGANLQKQYENWQPRVSLLYLFFLFFLTRKLQLLGLKPSLNPSKTLQGRHLLAGLPGTVACWCALVWFLTAAHMSLSHAWRRLFCVIPLP